MLAPATDVATTPLAGNIGLVLNTTSVQHVLTTALPLAAYFGLNNKTIPLNIKESSIFYKLTLNSIHINTVSLGMPVFEKYDDTQKLHVNLSNINIDTDIDGEFSVLHIIPFKAQKIALKDVSIDMVLVSTASDNVHWQLADVTKMTVGSFNVTLSNKFLNTFVHYFDSAINSLVHKLSPLLSKLVDQQINDLNKMVNEQTPFTWDLSLLSKSYPLNMTMTTAPQVPKESNLIKLNFDGTFHQAESTFPAGPSHAYFPDLAKSHREQLWVHENTFNTLINAAKDDYLPYTMDSDSMSMSILKIMPELQKVCGQLSEESEIFEFDDKCKFSATINYKDVSSLILKMTQEKGIQLGDLKQVATIDIMNVNSTVMTPAKVVSFETYFVMDVNFTMENVVFYPIFKNINFTDTKATMSSIKLGSHDFNQVLDSIVTLAGQDWNKKGEAGIPIAALNPQLAMIGGLIKNSTISPYISDGWLYAGFSMAADAPYYHRLYESEPKQEIFSSEEQQFLQ